MRRRDLIAALPALALGPSAASAAPTAFGADTVRDLARRLAAAPYEPPTRALPPVLESLDYDGYRRIIFAEERVIWERDRLPFRLMLFHRGGLFREKVQVSVVADGRAEEILYDPAMFQFSDGPNPVKAGPDFGFAGFRIHGPLNRPGVFDEIAVFLGASYFRAANAGNSFGLSARGLGIGIGQDGEEFPLFRSFWIERPAPGARHIVVHALLDGARCTGAFRFVITPGRTCTFDVEASIFPRQDLANMAIAPLTSMYLFGPENPRRFDDFRPEVHDSDGLMIDNSRGERLWRALSNPVRNQISLFADSDPKGYGLVQRQRAFAAYEDLEAQYHDRPSAWVTPKAGFGDGAVWLAELAARTEGEDNIGAYWRAAAPLPAQVEHRLAYRLDWSDLPPPRPERAPAVQWRSGAGHKSGRRRFVIDFDVPAAMAKSLQADVSASVGQLSVIDVRPNPETGGVRLAFELDPAGAPLSELRAALRQGGQVRTEVWTYRWIG